jgi:hypothetical protein
MLDELAPKYATMPPPAATAAGADAWWVRKK